MENKDSNHFVQALLVGANKFSEQKHIMAIRDGFITLMPATIIASFWVLINNLVLGANGLLGKFAWAAKLTLIGGQVYNATLGILAILIAYTIGERLTREYKGDDPSFGGVFGVISFFVLLPASLAVTTATGKNVTVAAIFSQNETSATGMFLAIISSLIGVTLLCKFNKIDKLRIKMPDSVPPALAKSFNVLIPAFLVSLIFGVVDFAVEVG